MGPDAGLVDEVVKLPFHLYWSDDNNRFDLLECAGVALSVTCARDPVLSGIVGLVVVCPGIALTQGRDRRIVRRMPRLQVYLPDALYDELKNRDLPASELLQVAVRAEIERQDALDATDRYLEELAAEIGEPSPRDRARAKRIVQRVQDRHLTKAG